jgi:hypothetical protein
VYGKTSASATLAHPLNLTSRPTSMPPVRPNNMSGITFSFNKPTAPSSSLPNPDSSQPTKAPPLLLSSVKKRPHTHFLDDSDSDESPHGIPSKIVAFDQAAGGAIGAHDDSSIATNAREKKVRTIAVAPNKRRWAPARGRQGQAAIPLAPVADGNSDGAKRDIDFGLSIMKKKGTADDTPVDEESKAAETEPPRTEDDMAMAALLGHKDSTTHFTIPVLTEDEALQRDMEDVGEQPTTESYLELPAEDFGAALLRGMGWKDTETFHGSGSGSGAGFKQPPKNERRAPLLGLGAKPADGLGIEIGSWGNKTRANEAYIPLILENRVTGERLTEEELKNHAEQESRRKISGGEMRGGNGSREERDKEVKRSSPRKTKQMSK